MPLPSEQGPPPRVRDYPYVVVRVSCGLCGRAGEYRLATLAERFGALCTLDSLLEQLAGRCPYPLPWKLRKRRKMQTVCHITLPDWDSRSCPPDLPPGGGVRLIVNNDAAE